MKKLFRSALMVSGLLVAMSSCKEEAAGTPLENSKSTATIKGILLYDKDASNNEDKDGDDILANINQDPAANAPIIVIYESELSDDKEIVKNYTTDAKGEFSITVPTTNEGTTVTIIAADFFTKFNGPTKEDDEKFANEDGYFPKKTLQSDLAVKPNEVKSIGKFTYGTFISLTVPSAL